LVGDVAVASCLLEILIVKLSALFEEEYNPACVKRCSHEEDKEDAEIIDCKDYTEDKKGEEREEQAQTTRREELLHTPVVFNTLQEVAH